MSEQGRKLANPILDQALNSLMDHSEGGAPDHAATSVVDTSSQSSVDGEVPQSAIDASDDDVFSYDDSLLHGDSTLSTKEDDADTDQSVTVDADNAQNGDELFDVLNPVYDSADTSNAVDATADNVAGSDDLFDILDSVNRDNAPTPANVDTDDARNEDSAFDPMGDITINEPDSFTSEGEQDLNISALDVTFDEPDDQVDTSTLLQQSDETDLTESANIDFDPAESIPEDLTIITEDAANLDESEIALDSTTQDSSSEVTPELDDTSLLGIDNVDDYQDDMMNGLIGDYNVNDFEMTDQTDFAQDDASDVDSTSKSDTSPLNEPVATDSDFDDLTGTGDDILALLEPDSTNDTADDSSYLDPADVDFDEAMGITTDDNSDSEITPETMNENDVADLSESDNDTDLSEDIGTKPGSNFEPDPADIMADMIQGDTDTIEGFMAEDATPTLDDPLGPISSATDLGNYLDQLEIPIGPNAADNISSTAELASTQPQPDAVHQPLPEEEVRDDAYSTTQQDKHTGSDMKTHDTDAVTSPENAPQKNSKLFLPLLLAVALGASGGLGLTILYGKYAGQNSNDAMNAVQNVEKRLIGEIQSVTKRADALESRMLETENKVEQSYTGLLQEQTKLLAEQKLIKDELAKMEIQAGNYEKEMLSRLETLLMLTEGLTAELSTQENRLKDTLFRETMAALAEKGGGADSAQLKKLISQLQKTDQRLEQVEVNLKSQRTLLNLVGDETEYVKGRLGELELNKGSLSLPVNPQKKEPAIEERGERPTTPVNDKTTSKVNSNESRGWDVSVSAKTEADATGYILLGVLQPSPGVFEIYLQPKNARDMTAHETYIYSASKRSFIPGYGAIKGVQEVTNSNSVVPYQVITETGVIVGRTRDGR